jgi:hypothetical protein
LIEVILEAEVTCPRCAALYKIMRRICDELNIPFSVMYNTPSSIFYEDTTAFHTFSKEWIERFGSEEQKEKLKDVEKVLNFIQREHINMYPVLRVRFVEGGGLQEIVIRGYDPSKEREFATNIYILLRVLKRAAYGRG